MPTAKKRNVKTKTKAKPWAEAKPEYEPLWKGPFEDGITHSLLSRFICCRERFRIYAIEGLRPVATFNHRIEYGQMWHVCEDSLNGDWALALKRYAQRLCQRYPMQQEAVLHWYEVCKAQFPIYRDYWSKHPLTDRRKRLLSEVAFAVPFTLPSGHTVLLRGKWDAVDLLLHDKENTLELNENKTKGEIVEQQVRGQLAFDQQTMIYLVALQEAQRQKQIPQLPPELRISGVNYNVIRRPLSGGKHSIRRHQPSNSNPRGETADEFYQRLADLIGSEPEHYFMRWTVTITKADISRFKTQFLVPILEQLCEWWLWMEEVRQTGKDPFQHRVHWRMPYGVYNVLLEGGSSELDEYIATGSRLGLERATTLFPELEPAEA